MTGGLIDPDEFRRVLGHVPTGVVVITSLGENGQPIGMAVGSFTSVSLDPPLVGFLPARTSSTFPQIERAGHFCVNVLAAEQEPICRSFAARGTDKFSGISWTPGPTGAPRLDGVVAWIDCSIEAITDAGDHQVVLGRVLDLAGAGDLLPLIFFQGGYGQFSPPSLGAPPEPDLVGHLRLVDLARPAMERTAAETDLECLATAIVGDELVVMASTGRPGGQRPPTRVGQRFPFVPPLGAPLVAWSPSDADAWVDRLPDTASPVARADQLASLERVRQRGWSVGMDSPSRRSLQTTLRQFPLTPTMQQRRSAERLVRELGDEYETPELCEDALYPVRDVSVPVFDPHGDVVLMLTIYGFPATSSWREVARQRDVLLAAAHEVSTRLAADADTSR